MLNKYYEITFTRQHCLWILVHFSQLTTLLFSCIVDLYNIYWEETKVSLFYLWNLWKDSVSVDVVLLLPMGRHLYCSRNSFLRLVSLDKIFLQMYVKLVNDLYKVGMMKRHWSDIGVKWRSLGNPTFQTLESVLTYCSLSDLTIC